VKARVAMEAIRGEKTIAAIASEYKIHPSQIMKWKKQLWENAALIFSKKKDPQLEENEALIDNLYKKIGQQDVELEFLKKKYKQMQAM
jgi:transposase-like protein